MVSTELLLVKAFTTKAYPHIFQHAIIVEGFVVLPFYGYDNREIPIYWVGGFVNNVFFLSFFFFCGLSLKKSLLGPYID